MVKKKPHGGSIDGIDISAAITSSTLRASTPPLLCGNTSASKPIVASPLTRNHSLKYTGGALHLANPVSFDHNYRNTCKKMGSSGDLSRSLVDDEQIKQRIGGCQRSQSFRLRTIQKIRSNSPEPGPSTPPISIPNARPIIVRRRDKSSDDDDDDDYQDTTDGTDVPSIYCTPPKSSEFLKIPKGMDYNTVSGNQPQQLQNLTSSSIAKSRSMVNLMVENEKVSAPVGRKVLASQARMRSFLLGSVSRTSLLGVEELQRFFPDRHLRIFVGTWNMNGASPPRHLADFLLPENIEYVPDILVIGTQETFAERTEWEIRLQDTLGPSHVLFTSHYLGTLHLTIFIRRDLIWFCSLPDVDSFNTRPGAQFKTKGAVAVALIVFGTSFLFINSHLTAHEENVKDRVNDIKRLNAMLNIPKFLPIRKRGTTLTDNFDVVFWCGDLNFRLEESRDVVIQKIFDGEPVLQYDQLNHLRLESRIIFKGFDESRIKFPPTYKYDLGTNHFDTSSKQRTPAYTDRILFKATNTSIKPLYYDSVQGVCTSDHKPVWGMWEVQLRPGKDSIPLAGGLFDREVYLEGLKRRSEALQPSLNGKYSSNPMCNMQ
ncbi:inositol polyphosphate 5-phosphatase E [Lepeophtheirus salmonis]|uniref:inositol polyphosphate 5-phosphatase E n=1 Tax=Lepeophtheirus salmonis TaxID=72036 RepID=UPI001AE3E0CF|nr:inositol polyphosphate 5-phosphatase E-like [Lepeophtheirus salmonis]XP_040572097.1 inositol polyphosphate 5-phosphatase E-like [Lepeophtheirus salmonis]